MVIPIFQFIWPLACPPLSHKAVFYICDYFSFINKLIFTLCFLFHIQVISHDIRLPLSDLLHSVWQKVWHEKGRRRALYIGEAWHPPAARWPSANRDRLCRQYASWIWWGEWHFTSVVFFPPNPQALTNREENIRQTQIEGHPIIYLASTSQNCQGH